MAHVQPILIDDHDATPAAAVPEIEKESRDVPSVPSPYLTSAEAAAYLRYKSGSAIRNLVVCGRLIPAGRRGRTY